MSGTKSERLHQRIDQYSVGFPPSPAGIELKIIEQLFISPEAECCLHRVRSLPVNAANVLCGIDTTHRV